MFRMQNPIREYAWGSTTLIPELLGTGVDGRPKAELWMGAHPDEPSTVLVDGAPRKLDAWLGRDPDHMLGERVHARFGPRLPYLMKLLAAASPLSLQVHPSAEQAERGFEEEEAAGVSPSARERRYKDPHHKPELILALTDFEAMCGLRPLSESVRIVRGLQVDHPDWATLTRRLRGADATALRAAFEFLLDRGADRAPLVEAVVAACRRRLEGEDEFATTDQTVLDLAAAYPGDPGVVLSLFLNRLSLQPGEALYLPAGNVHAYLSGLGVEIMASSDNVLRAGLTPKYIDIDELMSVVDFHPRAHPYVTPEVDGAVSRYRPGAAEFELAVVRPADAPVQVTETGPRVVMCAGGQLTVQAADGQDLHLAPGESVFVPGAQGQVTLSGPAGALAVVASVPPEPYFWS